MATPVFVHGKSSTFKISAIGGTPAVVNVEQATWTGEVDQDDITHTGASGHQVIIEGVERASGTIQFVYDSANKNTVSPHNMYAGQRGTIVVLPDGTDAFQTDVSFGSFSFSSGPKAGTVRVNVAWKSTAAITTPS